jgi:transposase-like protein
MSSILVDTLGKDPHRPHVVEECVGLIDAQVKQKGFLIKGAYSTIKTIKKKFVPEVVDAMLDDWLGKIQPHYDKWETTKPSTFADYIIARSDDVAEDLLKVTDERAEKTTHTTAKKLYLRMRDSAKRNVIEAIPELAKLLEKHLDGAGVA